jgi:protoheme IX farnesyltransferase
MFKAYYQLTKPGIIYGNALPAIAGFLLASQGHFDIRLFLSMLIGLSLVIASGCVFNNIYDADIDARMDRTKNRAIVTGTISKKNAIYFGTILIGFGCFALVLLTNGAALFAAAVGFAVYVYLYTPLKRKTSWATLIGAVAGATPPVVGYVSVTNNYDAGALILFLILVFWQMPHFYAIAIRRLEDYKAANIPVLPLTKGVKFTKIAMLFYCAAFIIAAIHLTIYKYTGNVYAIIVLILGLSWLTIGISGFTSADDKKWAKKMFLFSLILLTVLCVIISIDRFIK